MRDHRLHHKYADTNADPHNIKRGFFYAHIGWLMMKRHPELKEKSKYVNYNDALSDPVLQFQRRSLVLFYCQKLVNTKKLFDIFFLDIILY